MLGDGQSPGECTGLVQGFQGRSATERLPMGGGTGEEGQA